MKQAVLPLRVKWLLGKIDVAFEHLAFSSQVFEFIRMRASACVYQPDGDMREVVMGTWKGHYKLNIQISKVVMSK